MSNFKLIIGNPYDYNEVALKSRNQKLGVENLPSSTMALLNPVANIVGKWLGIDTAREKNQYYDRIWHLYQWAKISTNSNDPNKIIEFLNKKAANTPNMNSRKINDLFILYQLEQIKERKKLNTEKPKTTEDFVEDWVEEQLKAPKTNPQLSKLSAAKEEELTETKILKDEEVN